MANMNELQMVIDKKELSGRIICIARKKPVATDLFSA